MSSGTSPPSSVKIEKKKQIFTGLEDVLKFLETMLVSLTIHLGQLPVDHGSIVVSQSLVVSILDLTVDAIIKSQ